MIRLGLVGATDPRHRWFLAAAGRRRAGVRVVGLSDPDPQARAETAQLYDLPAWADHRSMFEAAKPSLVAVAQPDSGQLVIDALRHGADVLVAPPICEHPDELETIAELAASTGRRVTAVLTYRGHPAARTAVELLERLGRLQLVSLQLIGASADDSQRQATLEGFDLFQWLTGTPIRTVETVDAQHPARADEPAEIRETAGELILLAGAGDGSHPEDPVLEVRHRPDSAERQEVIQVFGEAGAIEWDTRTGIMRSSFDGRPPITVSCGHPDPPEWVLNNLLRKASPVISTDYSLQLARLRP